ncbi:hypothetical protein JXR93_01950 [bacterium]|nr:hypothetical protein [bacterium]
MSKYILLTSIIIFLFSCGGTTPEAASKCSQEDIWGDCDNENDYCYLGNCIPLGSKCEEDQQLAPCSDKTKLCVETESGFICELRPCSSKYPNGKCSDGEICYTNPTTKVVACSPECSIGNLAGVCSDSNQVCWNGECIENSLICSSTNQTGLCLTGKICKNGECLDRCSSDFPAGACETDKECIEGYCINSGNKCSTQNPTGECPPEKICKDGDCFYVCSLERPFGECGDSEQSCIEGNCQYPCSTQHTNGFCEESIETCVEGVCTPPCSQFAQNGYCDEGYLCVAGSCIESCSITFPNGYCETGKECFSGVCASPCSSENKTGLCHDENQYCDNGVCINQCSTVYPTGACLNSYDYCDNGVCTPYPCGALNPQGSCPNDGELCLNNICVAECSAAVPNGYCPQATWICYLGVCYHPTQQPCSNIFPEGYCNEHFSCISGNCVEDLCSISYPTGRCEIQGEICNNGVCEAPGICIDSRPLNGTQGACCQTRADCPGDDADWFSDCIMNDNEGYYCININVSTSVGGTGCSNDSQCNDPYSTYGEEQDYFCNQVWQKDGYGETEYDIRYCERTPLNCENNQRSVDVGQACDSSCGDIQCKVGLHCIGGVCTRNCNAQNGFENNPACFSVTNNGNTKQFGCYPYAFKAASFGFFTFNTEFCRNSCYSNNDCVIDGTTCNSFERVSYTGLVQAFCAKPTNPTGGLEKAFCSTPDDCATNICSIEDNQCTIPCDDDLDCLQTGKKGFCDFDLGFASDDRTHYTEFLGLCRYMDDTSVVAQTCNHKSQCPNGYNCIARVTATDSVEGVCAILEDNTRAYNEAGGFCGDDFWFCKSDLCINSVCRDYCNSTSLCNSGELCAPFKIREGAYIDGGVTNKEVYAGYCLPFTGSSLAQCSNSISPCASNNETCHFNMPGLVQNSSQIEYLCMAKQQGAIVGNACTEHSDCQSGICNPNTNVCTVACQSDVQCEGFNGCNQQGLVAIYDDNPANQVYVGLCE